MPPELQLLFKPGAASTVHCACLACLLNWQLLLQQRSGIQVEPTHKLYVNLYRRSFMMPDCLPTLRIDLPFVSSSRVAEMSHSAEKHREHKPF